MVMWRLASLGEEDVDAEVRHGNFWPTWLGEELMVGKQILCRARLEAHVLDEEARAEFLSGKAGGVMRLVR